MKQWWRDLTIVMGIAAVLMVLVSFGMKAMYHEKQEKAPKVMIKQSAWTRLTSQPCNIGTMEFVSGYIICERKRNARPIRSSNRGDRASRSRNLQSALPPRTQKD